MKTWRCRSCGAEYTPEPPDYTCPECGSGNTVPVGYQAPPDYERPETRDEPERLCPGCGEAMRCGYLVETNAPLALLTLGEGIYWTPGEAGLLGERVALKAYMCPGCGYVGLYARWLEKHRAIIEKASYSCR